MDKLTEIQNGIRAALWLKPGSEIIDQPDWFQAIIPDAAHPFHSRVLRARMNTEDAPRKIQETLEQFRRRTQGLLWFIFPDSTPENLPGLLLRAGMEEDHQGLAMVADIKKIRIQPNPSISVEVVTTENLADYVEASYQGWGHPIEVKKKMFRDMSEALKDPHHNRIYYLARYQDAPAGTGVLLPLKNSGYLQGSSVTPEFRGKGVYRALVRERLEYLNKRGAIWATILAMKDTSGPICERLGFETICEFRVFKKIF